MNGSSPPNPKTQYPVRLVIACIAVVTSAFLFEATGFVSFGMLVLGVWLAIAMLVVWMLSYAIHRCGWLKQPWQIRTLLRLPLLLIVTGAVGLAVMNVYAPPALPPADMPPSRQLEYLFQSDQGDRFAMRFRLMKDRDRLRRDRVLSLYTQGKFETGQDAYRAAMVLQHGATPEDYKLAFELAKQADKTNVEGAENLWKCAYDRWMLSLGKPQVYGTQSQAIFSIFGVSFDQRP